MKPSPALNKQLLRVRAALANSQHLLCSGLYLGDQTASQPWCSQHHHHQVLGGDFGSWGKPSVTRELRDCRGWSPCTGAFLLTPWELVWRGLEAPRRVRQGGLPLCLSGPGVTHHCLPGNPVWKAKQAPLWETSSGRSREKIFSTSQKPTYTYTLMKMFLKWESLLIWLATLR